MKRRIISIALPLAVSISLVMFYIGNKSSNFALKDKCAKFIEIARVRYKGGQFEGTFYSKSKQTCVSFYEYYGDGYSAFDIYDELTGQLLLKLGSLDDKEDLLNSLDILK